MNRPITNRIAKYLFHFYFFNLINLFLIGGWLLYNISLVSAIHQHESAIGIHMSPPCWNTLPSSHPSVMLQSPSLNSMSHTGNSHWLTFLWWCICLNASLSNCPTHPLFPSMCPQVCSLCPYHHCCPTNWFISATFLDSLYMHQYIFVFLLLTYFTLYIF